MDWFRPDVPADDQAWFGSFIAQAPGKKGNSDYRTRNIEHGNAVTPCFGLPHSVFDIRDSHFF
jgi:hypothetical protein